MRYEEMGKPFGEGWTYGEDGVIYTPSGYRCTPQQIEGMLWLFGCLPFRPDKLLIHSDEAAGALRPLLELADLDDSGQMPPTRLWLAADSTRTAGARSQLHAARRQRPYGHSRSVEKR
ncbi:MAG: hypothetical protein OJF61_001119 [Rhodanobacteraceae bacterium]|jgi:hypothetical protein|nr:MAG: hypothetical protein OJF61_001119 [Rhodanobacteraceae bacterium]